MNIELKALDTEVLVWQSVMQEPVGVHSFNRYLLSISVLSARREGARQSRVFRPGFPDSDFIVTDAAMANTWKTAFVSSFLVPKRCCTSEAHPEWQFSVCSSKIPLCVSIDGAN